MVICSDLSQSMLDRAAGRAAERGLKNVSTMILDMEDLSTIPPGSQDVVTANFALQNVPDFSEVLRQIEQVLRPGGVLVGTVWQEFSVVTVAEQAYAALMGLPAPDPEASKYAGSLRLGDLEMVNSSLAEVGLKPCRGHDSLGQTRFDVGPVAGQAWKHVLIGHLPTLEELERGGDSGIQGRAQEVVQVITTSQGYVDQGILYMPGTFRNIRVIKPGCVYALNEVIVSHYMYT